MNQAWLRVMALLYDPFLWRGEIAGMRRRRRALVAAARGRVLEIGAGTGLNIPHYPAEVDALILSEPEPGMRHRLAGRLRRHGRTAQQPVSDRGGRRRDPARIAVTSPESATPRRWPVQAMRRPRRPF